MGHFNGYNLRECSTKKETIWTNYERSRIALE